jgi:hypothetical protein
MKTSIKKILFISLLLTAWSCGQKSNDHMEHDHTHGEATSEGSNDALYNEVMKIHDETMMKMNDIYSLKQTLTSKLSDSAKLDEPKKEQIKASIAKLDSANESMMLWMRAFSPIPDSLGEEKAREYLETEMEKVNQVRSNIIQSLEEGNTLK